MDYRIEKEGDNCTLTFKGELVVREAQRVKDALIKAVEGCNQVTINMRNITEIDLSFMQLLYSAHCLSLTLKKNLFIENRGFDELKGILESAGFASWMGRFTGDGKKEHPQET